MWKRFFCFMLIEENILKNIMIWYNHYRINNVRKAILFGSVAKGTNQNNSDLDIVVDSNLKGLRLLVCSKICNKR